MTAGTQYTDQGKKMEDKADGLREDEKTKRLCPFINKPFENCYIVNMISLNIEAVTYYCGKNYQECEIYRENCKP